MALFRFAFFRLFALVFRHFAWRISFFRLFAWRYFVFSLFRLAFFRYFVFSLGAISSWRRATTPGEKTKERNNEIAQTSHLIFLRTVECTLIPIKSWIANSQDKLEFVRMSVAKNDNTGVKLEVPRVTDVMRKQRRNNAGTGATALYRHGLSAVPAQHVISKLLIAQ